ncbi:hypothetical protein ABI59_19055 [Acidobacteria bacterium Mor1]|nr:hypothetical protein ABI59_19055 [Acidobacteria bacterium Mor1]
MGKSLKIIAFVSLALLALPAAADEAPADPLDRLSGTDLVVMLKFTKVSASMPLKAMSRTTPFELELGPGVEKVVVDVDYGEMTVRKALKRLAREYGLVYTVPAHDKLIVDLARTKAGKGADE